MKIPVVLYWHANVITLLGFDAPHPALVGQNVAVHLNSYQGKWLMIEIVLPMQVSVCISKTKFFEPFSDIPAAAVPIARYYYLVTRLIPFGQRSSQINPELVPRACVQRC